MTVNHDVVGSSPTWGASKRKKIRKSVSSFFYLVCSWTRTARRLYFWCYHKSVCRNQQPEWLLVRARPPAAASPTWGAKNNSRSNDLLLFFCFLNLDSNQSHVLLSRWSWWWRRTGTAPTERRNQKTVQWTVFPPWPGGRVQHPELQYDSDVCLFICSICR